MKKNTLIRIISVVVLLCVLPTASALAWKISADTTIKRGYIDDSGVMFQVPASFMLDSVTVEPGKDELRFVGPTDTNGFAAEILVTLFPEEADLATVTADAVDADIYDRLNGDNILNLVSKDTQTADGTPMRMHIFFYNAEVGSMGMVYRYDLNLNGCYVIVEYNAFTATRTLPDEVPQLPGMMDSLTISE